MSEPAIASSWARTSTSSPRKSNSAARTSSGHSIVSSTNTPSRTRNVARDSRLRRAIFTTATLPDSSSASRSRTYGLTPALSGSR